jgi:two-component system OmpR family response regulator
MPRLLVAEDEVRMASLLKRGLEEEGYQVDVASDGREAVRTAGQSGYSAVVLDVMLPEMDGFEVCRQLRRASNWVPVLMLTARDQVEDRVRGLDAGADDYLIKPFSFAELVARLRALVRRAGPTESDELRVGDLRLQPSCHQVWRGSVEITLSAREFALLELFMRHVGQVLTRARILDRVWDFAYEGTSNVVDQYVAYLRRKIDHPFGTADLETVRGLGYRLRRPPSR